MMNNDLRVAKKGLRIKHSENRTMKGSKLRKYYRSHWRSFLVKAGSGLSRRKRTRVSAVKNLIKKLKLKSLRRLEQSSDNNSEIIVGGENVAVKSAFKVRQMAKDIDSGRCSNDSDDPDLEITDTDDYSTTSLDPFPDCSEEFEKDSGCDDWDLCKDVFMMMICSASSRSFDSSR